VLTLGRYKTQETVADSIESALLLSRVRDRKVIPAADFKPTSSKQQRKLQEAKPIDFAASKGF
jgi:hypothetical protein